MSVTTGGRAWQAYTSYKLGGPLSELLYSPAAFGIDFGARDAPRPRARANPMLGVCGNTLWLLGGAVEVRSRAHAQLHTGCVAFEAVPCQVAGVHMLCCKWRPARRLPAALAEVH
jgi:hypothetical protein